MHSRTRHILRTTLPIAFWLLAGLALYLFYRFSPYTRWEGALVLLGILPLVRHANPHTGYWSKEAFTCALLLAFSSYWIPTILFLTPLIFVLVGHYRLVTLRTLLAVLLGFATVAIYATLFIYLGWCHNPWCTFLCPQLLWGWIPIATIVLALIDTLAIRHVLEDRKC